MQGYWRQHFIQPNFDRIEIHDLARINLWLAVPRLSLKILNHALVLLDLEARVI